MERKENKQIKPTLAPGMDDQEELNQDASEKDIKQSEYTEVTTLSYDEVDPS